MNSKDITPLTYQRILQRVHIFIISMNGSMQDVHDILHQGFLEYFKKKSNLNFKLSVKPEYYIFAICKNLWYREIRRRGNPVALFPNNEMGDFLENTEDHPEILKKKEILISFLFQGIKQLSPKCQEVFWLRMEGLSCQQICKKMGFKNTNISKDKFYKCKRRLLQILSENPEFIEYLNNN